MSLAVIKSLNYFFDPHNPYHIGVESTENDQPLRNDQPSRTDPINDKSIYVENIIDFSFNIGTLSDDNKRPVLNMKLSSILSRINGLYVPKGWGWDT